MAFGNINTANVKTIDLHPYHNPNELKRIIRMGLDDMMNGRKKCIIFIHGYGEHAGGTHITLTRTRNELEYYNDKFHIVKGEEFGMFNDGSRKLKEKYPELAAIYGIGNHGITVVGCK